MEVPRGTKVRVKLGAIDDMTLDISGSLIERLDAAMPEGDADTEDEEDLAGPISIAVDVSADEPASQNGDNQSP
jgi:exoribonuclease II